MTPCSYCYLDYGQGLKDDPFFYIGGRVTLERCYSFDPCAGVPDDAKSHILGGQGNNWTEYTWNEYDLAWKAWPRMLALAEVFWLGEAKPGFADFKPRAAAQRNVYSVYAKQGFFPKLLFIPSGESLFRWRCGIT